MSDLYMAFICTGMGIFFLGYACGYDKGGEDYMKEDAKQRLREFMRKSRKDIK